MLPGFNGFSFPTSEVCFVPRRAQDFGKPSLPKVNLGQDGLYAALQDFKDRGSRSALAA